MSSVAIARPVPAIRTSSIRTSAGATRATYRRRRLVAVALLVLLAFAVTVAIGRVGAQAGLEDRVAGHVVVEPGQSLWDVAVATSPDGVDPREQLAAIRDLNGIHGAHVEQWAVVLIPAR